MRLREHEGKRLFWEVGIPVPKGFVVSSSSIEPFADRVVLKAQVLSGGRGKAGGIVLADRDSLALELNSLLQKDINGERVREILVEERLDIVDELYLSIAIDRSNRIYVIIYSERGGIDIEDAASSSPDDVLKFSFYDIDDAVRQLPPDVGDVAVRLFRVMRDRDAELVEINPLVRTSSGILVAADSKVVIDDNALFRQSFAGERLEKTPIEEAASECGLQYVELDGDIAVVGNGAGLVMATLDVLAHYGGKPANFLDVGGGASVEKMKRALEIVQLKGPKGIFVNIFGGITRCDDVAKAIVASKPSIPMVVRMIGTNDAEAREILSEAGIVSFDGLDTAAEEVVRQCQY